MSLAQQNLGFGFFKMNRLGSQEKESHNLLHQDIHFINTVINAPSPEAGNIHGLLINIKIIQILTLDLV